ncbi:MAG TPA: SMP-30/gluconolactonase/LRE family protein [Devosiaceae bacterium]
MRSSISKDKGPSPEEDAGPEVPGAQALMRGLDVLMAIGMAPEPPRFRDIFASVGIPKGTLHRLLAALQRRRLVRYDERTRQYHVGSRVFDLARRTLDQSAIIRAAKPELARIARQLRRTICLYVLDGSDVFVIDFEDPDTAQTSMVRIWPRQPVAHSAGGLAIVAAMPAEERMELTESDDADEKRQLDIGLTQALGYTIFGGEPGTRTEVAAAIVDDDGYPIAAICCPFEGGQVPAEMLHEAGRTIAEGATRASGNVGMSKGASVVQPAPATVPDRRLVNLQTGRDFMGENPVWCPSRRQLFWLDILAPALRTFDPATGVAERIALPEITGGLAMGTDNRLILLGQKGVFSFDIASQRHGLLIHPESDRPDNRFNTAAVDGRGNIWAATMAINHEPGHGGLYRISGDLSVRRPIARLGLPKNVAWSPDNKTMYLSDGENGVLCAYPFSLDDGVVGPARTLVTGHEGIGIPNGLTVDSEGAIWVAMLGGWAVHRYAPDGKLIEAIGLPIPMPTNVAFGGDDLKTLYITSTYLRLPPGFSTMAPISGTLLSMKTDVAGQIPNVFGQGSGK